MKPLFVLLLILHLLLTALCCLLCRARLLHLPGMALLVVLLVPPVGYLAALAAHIRSLHHEDDAIRQTGLEKLTVNNEVYKNVFLGIEGDDLNTVPLQDALLLNDAGTRRRLMMDVLNSDTENYVSLLSTARNDKDTEVSHYAATAMVELMKERELGVQRYEQRLEHAPDDAQTLLEYLDYLADYLDMGLLDGAMLEMYRYTYLRLIDRYSALCGPQLSLTSAKLDTLLALGEYGEATQTSEAALREWPDEGESYLMQIRLFRALKKPEGIRAALDTIRQRGVYLTQAQRETVEFWEGRPGAEGNTPLTE